MVCEENYPRLVDNSDSAVLIKDTLSRGRVEICVDNSFHTICEDGWTNTDASVLCSELGFSRYGGRYKLSVCSLYLSCFVSKVLLDWTMISSKRTVLMSLKLHCHSLHAMETRVGLQSVLILLELLLGVRHPQLSVKVDASFLPAIMLKSSIFNRCDTS